ncbi:DUF3489 domain-containing protein [Belnapia arida]
MRSPRCGPPSPASPPDRRAIRPDLARRARTQAATGARHAAPARWRHRRPDCRATGWQAHTVRGFFAGLERRQGITVEAAERVRQVGFGKEGAKGSYSVYRIAEVS